jgi:hypothetical protein
MGRVIDSRARDYRRNTTTKVTARAIINGRHYVKFATGWLSGYWVRNTGDIDFI